MNQNRMSGLLCGILFLCLTISRSEWVENRGLWYYISKDESPVRYQDAIDSCVSLDAHLAVITLDQQNDFLVDKIDSDGEFWIGLSTRNVIDHCDMSLQWIYDTHCKTDFRKYLKSYNFSTDSGCIGATLRKKQWRKKECSEKYKFICQWECKLIHFQFELVQEFSGVYALDHYWNGHGVYKQEGTTFTMEIYKSKNNEQWELALVQNNVFITIATYQNNLYVPYADSMSWKANKMSTASGAFCIDCELLTVRYDRNVDGSDFDETLIFHLQGVKYVSKNTSFFMGQLHLNGLYKHCVCESMHYGCGSSCGYIFPYPHISANITVGTKNAISINNLCTNTTRILKTTPKTTIIGHNIHRIITYGISTLVIIGISVTVAVIVYMIVKRKRVLTNHKFTYVNENQNIAGSHDDGENVEIGDGCSVENRNSTHDPESVEYSYAGVTKHNKPFAEPGSTNQSVTSNDATANEYPGGFLAPDYGVLIGNTKHSSTSKTSTPIKTPDQDNNIYSEVKVSNLSKTCKQQSNKEVPADNEPDEDLQLHENELYM